MSHHFSFLFIYLFFHITFLRKVHLVKAMVFPVVMYGCESWTVKKAERWRIDAFELWCWRRLLRVPWTARSTQSILKKISAEYSLEGYAEAPILCPVDVKNWLNAKDPDAGKDWGQEPKGSTEDDEMVKWHHQLNDDEQTLGNSGGQRSLVWCSACGSKELDTTEWLAHNSNHEWLKAPRYLSAILLVVV